MPSQLPDHAKKRLDDLLDSFTEASLTQIGYPVNQEFDYSDLYPFLQYSANNVGDPFQGTNFRINTHDIEREVIADFAGLMHLEPEHAWGYVTSGGTEGNMYGLYIGRELYPDGTVYFSQDTHYSVVKLLRLLNMRSVMIRSQQNGEMDYDDLRESLRVNPDSSAIIVANIGTTMKGAVDNLDNIREILERLKVRESYIHRRRRPQRHGAPLRPRPPASRVRRRYRQHRRQRPQGNRVSGTLWSSPDQKGLCRPDSSVHRVRRSPGYHYPGVP